MSEPMSEERLAEIRLSLSDGRKYPYTWETLDTYRELLAEVDRLRAALGDAKDPETLVEKFLQNPTHRKEFLAAMESENAENLKDAITQENEACAKLVEGYGGPRSMLCAAAIRARRTRLREV